jgi:hypothetical protein
MTVYVYDAITGNHFQNVFNQQQFATQPQQQQLLLADVCQTIIQAIKNSMNGPQKQITVQEWNNRAYVTVGNGQNIPPLCLPPFTMQMQQQEQEQQRQQQGNKPRIGQNLLLANNNNNVKKILTLYSFLH